MPLWLHIFNPLVMLATIACVIAINFGFLCIASLGTAEKKHLKFATSNLMTAFLCSASEITIGYVIMVCVFIFAGNSLQTGLLNCDYASMNVLKIPILSLCASAIVGYLMSRFIIFRDSCFDKVTGTALSIAFLLLNLPYVLIIPVII